MTHRVDFGKRRDGGIFAGHQRIEHQRHSVVVVGHLRVDDHFVVVKSMFMERLGAANAFANALGHERMRFNIDELVFQR